MNKFTYDPHLEMTVKSRRSFLKMLSVGGAVLAFPGLAKAALNSHSAARHLTFDNLHTGEKLAVTYFENGQYLADALTQINHLLRDHRTDETHRIDPGLLDLLYTIKQQLGFRQPFQIVSGYRSPKTNAMLNKTTHGVAKKSLHMQGKAIDICVEKVDLKHIKNAAIALGRGGVGYYPGSFVHLDTGNVRNW
jgi:uncharacterized protein YcbK (DUF882 family)